MSSSSRWAWHRPAERRMKEEKRPLLSKTKTALLVGETKNTRFLLSIHTPLLHSSYRGCVGGSASHTRPSSPPPRGSSTSKPYAAATPSPHDQTTKEEKQVPTQALGGDKEERGSYRPLSLASYPTFSSRTLRATSRGPSPLGGRHCVGPV